MIIDKGNNMKTPMIPKAKMFPAISKGKLASISHEKSESMKERKDEKKMGKG